MKKKIGLIVSLALVIVFYALAVTMPATELLTPASYVYAGVFLSVIVLLLTQALPDLLSAEIGPDGDAPPYPERAETEYARIVVVTLRELPGSAENGAVTVLRAAPEELDREEGLYLAL